MVQKVTIHPSYRSVRTMPPRCRPCATNSIISLQFWRTYTGFLLSKESNTRCCSSRINLSIVKPLHISPSWCLCILQTGPCDQRPKISSEYQPREQGSWGQHGAHLGPVGPRWAPCWPYEPCYQGRCRLEGFGRCCFAYMYAAPTLWNPLPTPVKRASSTDTFKSSLKTYLFDVPHSAIHRLLYCMDILFVTLLSVFHLQAILSTVTSHHFLISAM